MAIRFIFMITCLFFGGLAGGVENHLKRNLIKPKEYHHRMKNIDFIYLINLDKRPEKFTQCKEQLQPYKIHPYRFSAVNGWELSIETLNDLGVKYESWMSNKGWGTSYLPEDHFSPFHDIVHVVGRNYFCHCMSRGAVGITLSHLSILQDAYDSGYETIWVMEDDIQVIKNPHLLSRLIKELDDLVGKNGWDILFTDQDTKNKKGEYIPCLSYAWKPNFTPKDPIRFSTRENVGEHFRKIGARYGAYSLILRRSGIKKILKFIKKYKIFLPYDMEYYLPYPIHIYTVLDDVISTLPDALSDNGAPNYKNSVNP